MQSIGLLINMMESTGDNHKTFMEMKVEVKQSEKSTPRTMTAVQAVVEVNCSSLIYSELKVCRLEGRKYSKCDFTRARVLGYRHKKL